MGTEPSTSHDPPEVVARIAEGLPLVEQVARQMRRQLGSSVLREDLASHGREALLTAARSFDPDRQIPFTRWAALRIRGAMIDAARSSTNLPRRVYRKLRALQNANFVREGVNEEAAGAPPPGTPEAAEAKLEDELASSAMAMALGFLHIEGGDTLARAVDPDSGPESNVGRAELLDRIRAAIAERPEQEQALLTRHYFDEMTVEEAAKELGLSKSWACRLHLRAIEGVARSLRRAGVDPPR